MEVLLKPFVYILKKLDLGSAIAVRLTKITGKSTFPLHPKHFLTNKPWFTDCLNKSDIILDVGCGNGQNSIKTSYSVKKVIGVDLNKQLLIQALKEAKRRKRKNISYKTFDLETRLKFQDNFFNKILFLDVLEHLKNRDQILMELKRIIKPGGFLFLSVPNSQTSWKKLQRKAGFCSYSDPDHKIEFSKIQIVRLLEKHGFFIKDIGLGKFDIPLRGLVDILGAISLSFYRIVTTWRINLSEKFPKEASGFEIVAYVGK